MKVKSMRIPEDIEQAIEYVSKVEKIENAQITFLIREDLKEGFSLFEGVDLIIAKNWERGKHYKADKKLRSKFDVIIEKPDPTYWVSWQIGKVIPKLKFDRAHDKLYKKFNLGEKREYIGVQTKASTTHSNWRDWPVQLWRCS